ncbi:G-patch domain and KOW motifs-containing protein-like [Ruditapes philippinarum]|uniref:G-patch domain and KOW motifs-containing protein-like n=1 Tax=Ruditapes philippinarum TaxID=129788 RepID=UPI00295B15DC|nr:G-patch domain and KOW motifs-containing protein-like [Ruditapes philippinarum]
MGLGADRKQAQTLNSTKQGGNSKKNEDSGELTMKKGAHCLIQNGPHKDLYAVIEGLDEDNARLMLKLTVSGKLVTVSQYNTKLVTQEEYNKYSKYINKGAADRYKEKEEIRKEKKHRDSDRENESHRENKHRKEEDRLSADDDVYKGQHDRKKDKNRDKDRSNKKRKHDDLRSHDKYTSSSSYTNGGSKSQSSIWVRPKLRVRLVDEQYKKGKYYNNKVVIVDVSDRDHCMCKTDDGKILEDVSQSMLETMVPKSDSSYISIVSGKHKGQLGHVLERDKKKCQALVQLLSDRDKVLQLDYDCICEYVGDIDEEFDF